MPRAGQRFVFKLCDYIETVSPESPEVSFGLLWHFFPGSYREKHLTSYTFVATENKCVCVPHSRSRGSVDAEAVQLIHVFLQRKNSLE